MVVPFTNPVIGSDEAIWTLRRRLLGNAYQLSLNVTPIGSCFRKRVASDQEVVPPCSVELVSNQVARHISTRILHKVQFW
jgi:hypothetical protein